MAQPHKHIYKAMTPRLVCAVCDSEKSIHIIELSELELDHIYKVTKKYNDLCWQEIQRRRRDG